MFSSAKVTLTSNPQLIHQIETFLSEANNLIRSTQYRKCLLLMDGYYKKLLQSDTIILLKIKLLRRLCYCSVMYFQQKINKGEINGKRNQFILWSRSVLYLKEYHDLISMIKVQFQRKFHTEELIKILIKTFICRGYYYQVNQMNAKGLLYYHHIASSVIQQTYFEKNYNLLPLIGKYYLTNGNTYFQLLNYNNALKSYLKAFDYFQKHLEHLYRELMMRPQQEIKITLNYYTKGLIINLFIMIMLYEQSYDFIKYYEAIKLMNWIDYHYQLEDSISKSYFFSLIDITKYSDLALERIEISKILRFALPEEEVQKISYEESQVNYFNNKLYEFSELNQVKNYYFYYERVSQQNLNDITDTEIQIDKINQSKIIKTNFTQGIQKSLQIDSDSTCIGKSMQQKTKQSDQYQYSTRFSTEAITPQGKQQTSRKNCTQTQEDSTLQNFYFKAIEKSVKLKDLELLVQLHNVENEEQEKNTTQFNKMLSESIQSISFKRQFGNIGFRKKQFVHSTRESRKRELAQCTKQVNQLQQLLNCQIKIKRKENNALGQQYQNQRRLTTQSTPNILSKLQTNVYQTPNKTINIQQNEIGSDQKKKVDEQIVIKQMNATTKDIIKSLMDEKEQFISQNVHYLRTKSPNQPSKNNYLHDQLISNHQQLAQTTDQLSMIKKPHSLKTLLEIPKTQQGKRLSTILLQQSPRPASKIGSHSNLQIF